MIPGENLMGAGDLLGPDCDVIDLVVTNCSDRAIQVTSHFHFFEVNRRLAFARARALGRRLDIPAGTAVRFAPGESHTVRLRYFGGAQIIRGFNGLVDGPVCDPATRARAMERAGQRGFLDAATEK